MRHLVTIREIQGLNDIKDADNIEVATLKNLGWQVVVKKNTFKPNDKVVYFEIDSKVPEEEPFMFLQAKHFSIKTQKYFKGTVLSQGLLMSLTDFPKALHQDSAGNWVDAKGYDIDVYYPLTKALKVTYSVAEDNDRKSNVNQYENIYVFGDIHGCFEPLNNFFIENPFSEKNLLCPWDSPDKNAGVGCHALLQGIFPTRGWNSGRRTQGLLHCRRILYHLSH